MAMTQNTPQRQRPLALPSSSLCTASCSVEIRSSCDPTRASGALSTRWECSISSRSRHCSTIRESVIVSSGILLLYRILCKKQTISWVGSEGVEHKRTFFNHLLYTRPVFFRCTCLPTFLASEDVWLIAILVGGNVLRIVGRKLVCELAKVNIKYVGLPLL